MGGNAVARVEAKESERGKRGHMAAAVPASPLHRARVTRQQTPCRHYRHYRAPELFIASLRHISQKERNPKKTQSDERGPHRQNSCPFSSPLPCNQPARFPPPLPFRVCRVGGDGRAPRAAVQDCAGGRRRGAQAAGRAKEAAALPHAHGPRLFHRGPVRLARGCSCASHPAHGPPPPAPALR